MIPFPHGETVTRLRGVAAEDPYSDEETDLDWDDPDELSIPNCGFDPGGSTETVTVDRTPIVTQPTVYAPSGVDVTALDRLVVRSRTWQVDGDPAEWRNPFTGWEPGMLIRLKAVDG